MAEKEKKWIMGLSFLSNYYLMVDFEKKRIGFTEILLNGTNFYFNGNKW